jgi:radical SAM protein with 4Fe4S-binding SPASM domain
VQAAAAAAGVVFHWYSPTPLCLFNPIAHGLGNKGCAACDGLLAIAPDGALLPCSSFPERLGNLLVDGFPAAWQAPRAAAIRAKTLAPPACRNCTDFAACHGACPLYFNKHGFAEIEATDRYREARR